MAATNTTQQQIEDFANMADQALQQSEVDEAQRKLLVDDIRSLDLSKYVPESGELAAIAYMTDRGYEGFQYQSGKRPMMDSSKPLTILEHLGGDPLLFVASRSNDTVEDYDAGINWLKKIAAHAEQIAQSKTEPEKWVEYLKYRDRGIALFQRIDRANRDLLYPALDDGQGAFVLDTTAKSKQWINQMPPSPEELPMVELGIVCSVSDEEKLREGVKEYVAVVRDAVALVREINPEGLPPFELPKASESEVSGGGSIFSFSLPAEWGLDESIAPNAGITESAAALSAMPATTERLLAAKPLEIDTSLDLKRPAAKILHFKIAKTIDSIRPWVDYGLGVAAGTIKAEVEEEDVEVDGDDVEAEDEEEEVVEQSPLMFQMGLIVPQVYQLLDVVSTMKSATAITYEEDGLWVTHSETLIRDLED